MYLYYKIYEKSTDSTSVDYTIASDLTSDSYVTIFNLNTDTIYIVESYIKPYDSTVSNSQVTKMQIQTKKNIVNNCNAPTVSRDPVTGIYSATCNNGCIPVYRSAFKYNDNLLHNRELLIDTIFNESIYNIYGLTSWTPITLTHDRITDINNEYL